MAVTKRFRILMSKLVSKLGFEIRRSNSTPKPIEFNEQDNLIWEQVKSETMASFSNFWYLLSSIDYLVKNGIRGSFVECGVWRGGSAMTMAMRLAQLKETNVEIYLFDTYAGMVEPSSFDVEAQSGEFASDLLKYASDESYLRALAPLSLVKSNMEGTRYPKGKINYIEGDVLETLPVFETGEIALLRLDTDWYESTLAELRFLFPRLVKGGVCIIDDYGHWEGSRKAVDEFFETQQFKPLLFQVDYTCRAFIKV